MYLKLFRYFEIPRQNGRLFYFGCERGGRSDRLTLPSFHAASSKSEALPPQICPQNPCVARSEQLEKIQKLLNKVQRRHRPASRERTAVFPTPPTKPPRPRSSSTHETHALQNKTYHSERDAAEAAVGGQSPFCSCYPPLDPYRVVLFRIYDVCCLPLQTALPLFPKTATVPLPVKYFFIHPSISIYSSPLGIPAPSTHCWLVSTGTHTCCHDDTPRYLLMSDDTPEHALLPSISFNRALPPTHPKQALKYIHSCTIYLPTPSRIPPHPPRRAHLPLPIHPVPPANQPARRLPAGASDRVPRARVACVVLQPDPAWHSSR